MLPINVSKFENMLWTHCHARGVCGTFSFGLIDVRTVSSIIYQELCNKTGF
jgi:hypothetical protein